jgi:hypothetical protein
MSRGYIVPSLVSAARFEPFTIAIMEGRPSSVLTGTDGPRGSVSERHVLWADPKRSEKSRTIAQKELQRAEECAMSTISIRFPSTALRSGPGFLHRAISGVSA